MKKLFLPIAVISCLSLSLIACNSGGNNSSGPSTITPPVYKQHIPESYNAILSNNSILQTVNHMLLPSTQKSSIVLHLESSVATTINLNSNLSISPQSCTFDSSTKDCTINISNKGVQINKNYIITPSFGSQTLANINVSFNAPLQQPALVNLDGTWVKYTIGDTNIDPTNCSNTVLPQGSLHIIKDTKITYINTNTESTIQNPSRLKPIENSDVLNSTYQILANGVIGITEKSKNCKTNYYTTWTKISN